MKITDIKATPVNIPFTAPYVFSYGSIASLTKTIVEVVTDERRHGARRSRRRRPFGRCLKLRERLLGLDIREINAAERRCVPGHALHALGRHHRRQRRAFGGIEMALWDARGRDRGRAAVDACSAARCAREIAFTEYFSLSAFQARPIPAN